MTRVDLRAALDTLPRYNFDGKKDEWTQAGDRMMTNHQLIPPEVEKAFVKVVRAAIKSHWPSSHMSLDVTGGDIWVQHRSLKVKSINYLYRKNWAWQKWNPRNLPLLISYKRKYIVWNGTHRTTLCRMAHRRLHCWVLNLDEYIAERNKQRGRNK